LFEGLGSVYWHMIAKLLLAVQGCQRRAADPVAAAALARIYDDMRDGLGFRRTAEAYGAFPTDRYSHTPSRRGAQQPGMTGQATEQVLTRLGELGAEVVDGRVRFRPRLLHREELLDDPSTFSWVDVSGAERTTSLPAGSLAFTYCQVPVCYSAGDAPSIVLERADGRTEVIEGTELGREASAAIFERRGIYRLAVVTIPRDAWSPERAGTDNPNGSR
jgi:hypothetical protein